MKRYRRIGGFNDDTDYVELQDDGEGFLVTVTGKRKPMHWREVRNIPFAVEYGDWEEITNDQLQGTGVSR
jgi:hypothetical protein